MRGSRLLPVTSFALREKLKPAGCSPPPPSSSSSFSSSLHSFLCTLPHRLLLFACERQRLKMMQEVSIMVAYDAHVVERPGEEDALARLVARSRPLRSIRPVVGLLVRWLRGFFSPF